MLKGIRLETITIFNMVTYNILVVDEFIEFGKNTRDFNHVIVKKVNMTI